MHAIHVRLTAVLLLLSYDYAVKVTHAAVSWNYEDNTGYGPSHWATLFPNYCNGSQQSPIDIITQNTTQLASNFTSLQLTGYDTAPAGQPFQLLDNGHSVQVNVATKTFRATGASLLNYNYTLEQFHFHWGATTCDNEGSEHRLNGKAYPAEIHLVHYNSDLYANFTAAVNSNDPTAVAVFGVFVDVAASSTSRDLDVIISNISSVPEEGNTVNVVVWNVFEQPIYITDQQLAQFHTVKGDEHKTVEENFRPMQPLNDRIVYWYNVPVPSTGVTPCYSGPSTANASCTLTSTTPRSTLISSTPNINAAAGIHNQIVAVVMFIATAVSCLSGTIRVREGRL